MTIQRMTVNVTTNASGAVTADTLSFTGVLKAIHWVKPSSGGITGAAIAVTSVNTGEAVLSVSGVSASADYYPRGPVHSVTGVAVDYAAAGQPVTDALAFFQDQLQIAITGGGNTLNGEVIIIFDGSFP